MRCEHLDIKLSLNVNIQHLYAQSMCAFIVGYSFLCTIIPLLHSERSSVVTCKEFSYHPADMTEVILNIRRNWGLQKYKRSHLNLCESALSENKLTHV